MAPPIPHVEVKKKIRASQQNALIDRVNEHDERIEYLEENGTPGGGGGDPKVDWFTGHGPPAPFIEGAGLGDMYYDLDTGDLYQLN